MTRVVNLYKEPYDIYIGRPTMWGNPYSHKPGTLAEWLVDSREEAIERFKEDAAIAYSIHPEWLEPLRGKVLGCFCKPQACHGDVIVELLGE